MTRYLLIEVEIGESSSLTLEAVKLHGSFETSEALTNACIAIRPTYTDQMREEPFDLMFVLVTEDDGTQTVMKAHCRYWRHCPIQHPHYYWRFQREEWWFEDEAATIKTAPFTFYLEHPGGTYLTREAFERGLAACGGVGP